MLRRAFMTGGPAAVAALGRLWPAPASAAAGPAPVRVGEPEVGAVEQTVRAIRLVDDRHGADGIYRQAGESLRHAYHLLDTGARRQDLSDRLHNGAGELAVSVGWLAHDSGRITDARSYYAEALATARMNGDAALEAHAFCNTAFLAGDSGRHREAVRAAQAGQQAARGLPSDQLRALLALREAGGWAGQGDRRGCEQALSRAASLFDRGPRAEDPEWMSFFGPAEYAWLEAQCWAALGDWPRAVHSAREAARLQEPHFARNQALFTAALAGNLARGGQPEEAAAAGQDALDLLAQVGSARITGMLRDTARLLGPYAAGSPEVAAFLSRIPR